MRIIRFSTLKTFLITSGNLRRSIVAINIGIFLAIFAASSAVISLFIENELTDYEFSNIELRSTYIALNDYASLMPALKSSIDRAGMTAQTVSNYNDILAETKQGNLIIDERERYFYRFYSFFYLLEEFFTEDLSFKTGLEIDINEFYTSSDDLNQNLIDRFKKAEIDYNKYKEQFMEIKKNIAPYDQFEIVDPKNFFKNQQSKEYVKLMEKYETFSKHMDDITYFINDYIQLIEILMVDIKKWIDQILITNTNEIKKLSNLESKLIFFAFMLQLFIFLITQFFEISTLNREAEDKK